MYETVTVDEALKRGHRIVNLPVTFIMVGVMCLTAYMFVQFQPPAYFIFIGIVASFILAWLYWSVMITRWRIWAFENVSNVNELKKRAVKEKLIWKDGSFFEKTEIRTAADKRKLNSLQYKLAQPDVFIEDYSVADETEIHYSKKKTLGEIILGIAMVCGSTYFFIEPDTHFLGAAIIVIGLFITYFGIKKHKNNTPRIVLSNKGIRTFEIPFYEWGEIYNEDVIAVQTGKTRHHYFVYDNPSGAKRLDIGDLDIDRRKLESLLRIYRGRSNKNIPQY
ncbi:hypothetical protein BDD43_5293 [Mucilaginibacter gracilis]|uniref:Uncharacterized protein n=1 Tax=Mucilaginibacter gracilis TaxID=423350 RepID=A0A495J829_9SPHI|nr:hypothetical protein [Mucilaginibacter gracilis]RKR85037.1 hypothetical protein BDD43_5293 [Mucilaginibacter gracilis]